MRLSELPVGRRALIVGIETDAFTRERLRVRGFAVGARLTLLRLSFLRRALLVESAGIRLALQRQIAEQIEVEPCNIS